MKWLMIISEVFPYPLSPNLLVLRNKNHLTFQLEFFLCVYLATWDCSPKLPGEQYLSLQIFRSESWIPWSFNIVPQPVKFPFTTSRLFQPLSMCSHISIISLKKASLVMKCEVLHKESTQLISEVLANLNLVMTQHLMKIVWWILAKNTMSRGMLYGCLFFLSNSAHLAAFSAQILTESLSFQ